MIAAPRLDPDGRTGRVAETYLARNGAWNVPLLSGVTAAPFGRADGSACEVPGYDAASGLLYKPECEFPPVPPAPSKDDALRRTPMNDSSPLSSPSTGHSRSPWNKDKIIGPRPPLRPGHVWSIRAK
jgi:hypothetical protein